MLAEPALFRLPGSGPLTVAGAFASVLSEAIEEAMPGGSTGALGSALYRIGIPRDSVLRYQAELEAERFLLIVHGNQDMVHAAADVLHALEGSDVTVHTA
ncbi:MAG TPA: hypothetical protein ENK05_12765 [Gammaproteobacteria bacterium]|nr:hypothetical protein [Gammaproteobacteria bacterium]